MDLDIALILVQEGLTNGSIYALLALALVLVFAVTRVIFIPQGEFVSYGALTLVALQNGQRPLTLWLLCTFSVVIFCLDFKNSTERARLVWIHLVFPALLVCGIYLFPLDKLPLLVQVFLALAIVGPLAPQLYRLVYQPIADASVLILLITSVALHLALVGLGLLFFGAEGARTLPFSEASFTLGALLISGQSLWIIALAVALMAGLYVFFSKTLTGKALRATAINRTGARLMGISPVFSGRLSFGLAGFMGALSGVLISQSTPLSYDSGFLMGLKGFVGAIIGGLASFPVAAVGAVLVALLEAFSSFWLSAYKEVIVFTLIIPVLLWRSFKTHTLEEEE